MFKLGSIGSSQIHQIARFCASQARWMFDDTSFYGNASSVDEARQLLRVAVGDLSIPEAYADLMATNGTFSSLGQGLPQDVLLFQVGSRTTLELDGYCIHIPIIRTLLSDRPELLQQLFAQSSTDELYGTSEFEGYILSHAVPRRADDGQLLEALRDIHRLTGDRLVLIAPLALPRGETFSVTSNPELNATVKRCAAQLGLAVFDPTEAYLRTAARRGDLIEEEDAAAFISALSSEIADRLIAEVLAPYASFQRDAAGPIDAAMLAAWFGHWQEALNLCQQTLATADPSTRPALVELGARVADHLGSTDVALDLWLTRMQLDPPCPDLLFDAARLAFEGRHPEAAEALCVAAVTAEPSLAGAFLALCGAHEAPGLLETLLDRVLASGVPLKPTLGQMQAGSPSWHKIAQQAICRDELDPKDRALQPMLRHLLKDIRAAQIEADLARVRLYWGWFRRLDPSSLFHAQARRSCLLALGHHLREVDPDDAAALDELLALAPDDILGNELHARKLTEAGAHDEAAATLERLAETNPKNVRFQVHAIRKWLELGSREAALRIYHRVPDLHEVAALQRLAPQLGLPQRLIGNELSEFSRL